MQSAKITAFILLLALFGSILVWTYYNSEITFVLGELKNMSARGFLGKRIGFGINGNYLAALPDAFALSVVSGLKTPDGEPTIKIISSSISRNLNAKTPENATGTISFFIQAPLNKRVFISANSGLVPAIAGAGALAASSYFSNANRQGEFYAINPGETKIFTISGLILPQQAGYVSFYVKEILWLDRVDVPSTALKPRKIAESSLRGLKTANLFTRRQSQAREISAKADAQNALETLEPEKVSARGAVLRGKVVSLKAAAILNAGFYIERLSSQYKYAGQTKFSIYTPLRDQISKTEFIFPFQALLPESNYCYAAYAVEPDGKKIFGKQKCFDTLPEAESPEAETSVIFKN